MLRFGSDLESVVGSRPPGCGPDAQLVAADGCVGAALEVPRRVPARGRVGLSASFNIAFLTLMVQISWLLMMGEKTVEIDFGQ